MNPHRLVLLIALQLTPAPHVAPTPLYSVAADPIVLIDDEGCIVDQYGFWFIAEDGTFAFSSLSCDEAMSRVSKLKPPVRNYFREMPVLKHRV